jgi:hypothetical protein
MKPIILIKSILYAIAIALAISIIILSFFMSFTCEINLRYFIIFLSISVFCLALASILSIKK